MRRCAANLDPAIVVTGLCVIGSWRHDLAGTWLARIAAMPATRCRAAKDSRVPDARRAPRSSSGTVITARRAGDLDLSRRFQAASVP